MAPNQQGVFLGFAAASVTGMLAIILPPLPSNLLVPCWVLYGCALAWAILRWSYRLASTIPAEEGIPKHLQGVLIGVLFLTGSATVASLDIRPTWVRLLVGLGYLLAASQGVMAWNGHRPPEAAASK